MKNKTVWIIAGIVVLLVIVLATSYNRLVTLNESIDGSWAQVENVLQRRYDLIPNLVNTVKGYAKHEREVFTEVTRLRSQWGAAKTTAEKVSAASGLEGAISRLLLIVERYPELKANQNFLKLQDELAGTENRIAVERMRYNDVVRRYNISVKRIPTNIAAAIFGFAKRDVYFEAVKEAKEAPKVEF
ncbi:MAG: LemA family protein [Elusimicrobiota bacterium]|nr:LemA family protein [Elusimicrobiota bacterium]